MKNFTKQEIEEIYHTPLLELIFRAASVHREHHDAKKVQRCSLLSIKTGGCAEDCSYCPQSSRHEKKMKAEPYMDKEQVLEEAKKAKANGSTRFCMGAAQTRVRNNKDFENVLGMVKGVRELGMEACVTLGMLTKEQADRLKEAGLTAYNHNVDTSEEYYPKIISTRSYQERLDTLEAVGDAGISVCCGGILGMGESDDDHISMLHTLTKLKTAPESIPINALVPCDGTPLGNRPLISALDLARMIATTRILFPKARVRLSAGREVLTISDQALCFLAGASSIFAGDKLLTTPNPEWDRDEMMFQKLGLTAE